MSAASPLNRRRAIVQFLRRENTQGYLYIMPWAIGLLVFSAGPMLSTFYNSLTNNDLYDTPQWIGLQNYLTLLTKDNVFKQININMLIYVIGATCVTIGFGLLFAVLLSRDFPGNTFFRVLIYVPSLLVGVATGVLFKQIFSGGEGGLVNSVLHIVGLGPVNWLADYNNLWHGLLTLIMVNFWFVGGTMLIFLAGLKGINPVYYEAAQIDGASGWSQFRHITLPLLSPVIVLNTILTLIGHIQVFDTPLTFAANGQNFGFVNLLGYHNDIGTYLVYIYEKAFIENDFGYASAIAVIVFAITLILSLGVLGVARRFTYYGAVEKN